MKIFRSIIALAILFALSATPGLARDDMGGHKHGHGDGDRLGHYDKKMAHYEMMTGTLETIKEVMVILKDLNHKPTDAEKARLAEMITKMDENIAKMEEKIKKCDTIKKNPCAANPCGANPCAGNPCAGK